MTYSKFPYLLLLFFYWCYRHLLAILLAQYFINEIKSDYQHT